MQRDALERNVKVLLDRRMGILQRRTNAAVLRLADLHDMKHA